ncbi:hypothetical protein V1460_18110 [Streptomyces sp. SCSIO 30461]|uniref:hypothetical protein n=1 Tax=Streptomyces sp. SCSIO 30461 TaxID=3118085 RepID=UPI0030CC5725
MEGRRRRRRSRRRRAYRGCFPPRQGRCPRPRTTHQRGARAGPGTHARPHTRKDTLVAAICETDWDPERWYPSVEAREKAEAEDGKWPTKQALARLAAASQYIKQAPPPVPTLTREGKPYNEKYRVKKVASRQSGLDSSTTNVLREILSTVGATDHRLGAAFGKPGLRS